MSFINKSFHLSVQAKTKKVNLRVILKGAFYTSPLIKASTLACSINGRAKNFVVYIHLRILQAVGINSGDRQSNVVRYSVRLRLRKLWFRIRGKYAEGSNRDSVLKAVKSVDTKKTTRPVGGNFLTRRQVKGNIKDENEGGMFGRASSVKRPSLVITRFWLRRKNAGNKILPQRQVTGNFKHLAPCVNFVWKAQIRKIVQGVGIVATLIVLVQLIFARLPLLALSITGIVIAGSLFLMRNKEEISPEFLQLWQAFMNGIAVYIVPQKRYEKLPSNSLRILGIIASWITPFLYWWAPIAPIWRIFYMIAKRF